MKWKLYGGLFLLSLLGCREQTLPLETFPIPPFCDLYTAVVPTIPLFQDYRTLPIQITTGDYTDHNSILFLTESTNLVPIGAPNLQQLLPSEEYRDWRENHCTTLDPAQCSKVYFAYGRIVTENFVLLEFGIREYGDWGRHYTFQFRTYRHNGEQISSLDFAQWSDREESFFGGQLNSDWTIDRIQDDQCIGVFRVQPNGVIVM